MKGWGDSSVGVMCFLEFDSQNPHGKKNNRYVHFLSLSVKNNCPGTSSLRECVFWLQVVERFSSSWFKGGGNP